jgi:hypothetical protein
MEQSACTKDVAEAANHSFEKEMSEFLRAWVRDHGDQTLLQFDQTLEEYLENDALRDFFVNIQHPITHLLKYDFIACHLGRGIENVYFDAVNGDPLFARAEQRIYNLGRRLDSERMHVPFRTVQPDKQTEMGDTADISTYPLHSEEIRYNSGNHFISSPANGNVFDENRKRCISKAEGSLHIIFRRGFLEDRLQEVKETSSALFYLGEHQLQFFVIYSRHSPEEGHFGVSLVIMDPAKPEFPKRVLVCDTLLKELPHHPRWWHHFIAEYSNVFGDAIVEIIDDLSHPLQKVNIKGDEPYRHDWDCPYYAVSMAEALADLVKSKPELLLNGCSSDIHYAMKEAMPDYYEPHFEIKSRVAIRQANQVKRWESGRILIWDLLAEINLESSFEV